MRIEECEYKEEKHMPYRDTGETLGDVREKKEGSWNYPKEEFIVADPEYKLHTQSSNNIIFSSPDGRTAEIDYGGKEITYSGDLSVSESAKLFFDALKFLADNHHAKETERKREELAEYAHEAWSGWMKYLIL